jgi:hypothetical protein
VAWVACADTGASWGAASAKMHKPAKKRANRFRCLGNFGEKFCKDFHKNIFDYSPVLLIR